VSGPPRLALIGLLVFVAGGLFILLALRAWSPVGPSWASWVLYDVGFLLLIAGPALLIGAAIDAVRGRRRL
jgi:hypothetical protein